MKPVSCYVERFAGSAAVALALVGGDACIPPIGYMGGKRRLARDILGAAGLKVGQGADHVVLVDAGPWGEAWEVIFDPERHAALVATIRGWGQPNPSALWEQLRDQGRPEDPIERVASWLWLQGRSVSCTPVWWDDGAPVSPGNVSRGPGLSGACESGASRLIMADKPGKRPQAAQCAHTGETVQRTRAPKLKGQAHKHRDGGGGIVRPSTVADRIEAIGRAPWRQVTVLRSHADLDALGLDVDVEYMDPPYQGCTRYAAVCPRDEVLRMATAARDRGARAVVSEACALPLEGWHALQIGAREWLTCSEPPAVRPATQLTLWSSGGAA